MFDCDLNYYIIFSKSLYLPIREFSVPACYPCDDDQCRLYEEEVLALARKICMDVNYNFDDVLIYKRCFFKD